MSLNESERRMRASIASNTSCANTSDFSERTAAARASFLSRFEKEVDPEGVLPEADRVRRAEHLRKAYFQRLALRSAQARRRTVEAAESGDAG
jgi:hypothetical protein